MNADVSLPVTPLKPSDFASEDEVRWCPGCGDYAILAAMKKTLAKLNVDRAKTVFVSGIGCSSRFPYYLNTYGFHTIHGRAPTVASGLKITRPDLNVWVVTGDGDALSIGGNHFMHAIRRNMDLKIILFNNRIYGLTKGQYSPTSEFGKKTKSSPMGSLDYPVRPLSIAIAAEATFAARAIDMDLRHLEYVLERAAKHTGTAVVEIYQNCHIFNDGAFRWGLDKATRSDHVVYLEDGKPMVFGANNDKAIAVRGLVPQIVNVKDARPEELLVHNEQSPAPELAFLLSRLRYPEFPEPMGVFRDVPEEGYVDLLHKQIAQAVSERGEGDIQKLLTGTETWKVA